MLEREIMKIEVNYYELFLSSLKDSIEIDRIEGEQIIMLLESRQAPKFITLSTGDVINTSFLIAIKKEFADNGKGEEIELSKGQEQVHRKFLQTHPELKKLC